MFGLYFVAILCLLGLSQIPCSVAMSSEPDYMCSKFHYEESLLEKMVRGEIKFENLQQSVTKDLVGLNAQFHDMKRSIEDQLVAINQAKEEMLQTFQIQREAMTASTSTALDKVEKTLTDLGNLKDSWTISTVTFSSKRVVDTTLDTNQVIVFSETVFNHGNGYDSATGVFTVPVGGVYLFTVHLCIPYKKAIYYSIVVDNVEVTTGYNYDKDAYVCTTASTIVVLQSNQGVWVKCKSGESHLYQDSNRFNVFSGVLIHQ